MKTYKFLNKRPSRKLIWIAVIVSIASFILFTNVDIKVNNSIIYFLVMLIAYISGKSYIGKAKTIIEDISIDDSHYKIYFLNKTAKPMKILKEQVEVVIDIETVTFYEESGALIGVAYRNAIEEPELWDSLVNNLRKNP